MTKILPDCMMPDGADPCLGYTQLCERAERAEAERDALRDALDTLAKEEWRDDDDPILDAARVKARAALAKKGVE